MPLYEYQCRKCRKRIERIENFAGPFLKKCPHCGGAVERLMSAPAIQFKGSGWYVTDYAKSSSGGDRDKQDTSPSAETAESKAAEKKDQKKPAAKEKDKKSAGGK